MVHSVIFRIFSGEIARVLFTHANDPMATVYCRDGKKTSAILQCNAVADRLQVKELNQAAKEIIDAHARLFGRLPFACAPNAFAVRCFGVQPVNAASDQFVANRLVAVESRAALSFAQILV